MGQLSQNYTWGRVMLFSNTTVPRMLLDCLTVQLGDENHSLNVADLRRVGIALGVLVIVVCLTAYCFKRILRKARAMRENNMRLN
jgi:hypothetical protein